MSSRSLLRLLCVSAAVVLGASQAPAQTATVPPPLKPDARTGEIQAGRAALLAALTPVTDALLSDPPPGEWLQWRRTYDSQGFSPLAQINKKNVANLAPAWSWSLPSGTSEVTPLVHDGVLFVFGAGDRIQALDAAGGDLLWEYIRPTPATPPVGSSLKRNFAIYGDKLYVATADNHMIALTLKTGKLAWDRKLVDDALRFGISSGPLIVKGKVIQGLSQCWGAQPGGCYITALDADTGAEVWRFNTLARPGAPGGETWNGLPLERRHGGAVWTTGSYDPKLNLLYFGVGNTYNWQDLVKGESPGKDQPGVNHDGLYLNSTVALDPDTGRLVWHYQHLPGDLWDLDYAFERQLVDLPVEGKTRRVVVTTGKMAITEGMDAATGKWLFAKDLGLQNIVASIDPVTGKKTYAAGVEPDLTGARRNLQCPSSYGYKNWPANAYDPKTRVVYMTITESCGESLPRLFTPANPYTNGVQETRIIRYQPDSNGEIGGIEAVDLATRKTLWSIRQRAPMTGAALATAGGLVFTGDADRWFRAYDAATGKVLWQMRLNDAINSYPISYSVKGRQYVAIVAGFGGSRIANLRPLTTEIQTPRGGGSAVWVFELKGAPAK
jgi:alcohol dehydrogenase (cytochrome c)